MMFSEKCGTKTQNITDTISRYFTPILLLLLLGHLVIGFYYNTAFNVLRRFYCSLSLCFGIDCSIYDG
jgi:cation transport ATPase